jgi:hypothetical protein
MKSTEICSKSRATKQVTYSTYRRCTACSFVAGTLNSAAAFSIAVASSTVLDRADPGLLGGDFIDGPGNRLWRRFGLLCHAGKYRPQTIYVQSGF